MRGDRPKLLGKPLSPRERQIAEMIGQGMLQKEIAARLGISFANLRTRVTHQIYPKLGVHSIAGVGQWYARERSSSSVLRAEVVATLAEVKGMVNALAARIEALSEQLSRC